MAYLALARKWRPKAFSEVVGQSHVVQALSNALDSGRVHHAFLFTGTRGVGKTTLARIFAKSLNCEAGTSAEPCQECDTCRSIDEGRFVDLIEVDAASRTKVDDTRELLDNVQYASTSGKFKVYLIDEVHMLSGHSFNALLKTLEEPPEHVKFLFATTDPQKLPVTVLSRCLQFNLRAMRPDQVENQLVKILTAEGLEFDHPALTAISKAADGSMRDGLSLLDQAIAQGAGSVRLNDVQSMLGTIKAEHSDALLSGLAQGDANQIMQVVADMADHAVDFNAAIDELLMQLYHVSLAQLVPNTLAAKETDVVLISKLAEQLSPETIQLYYQIGLLGKRDIALAPSLRVGFEMTLLRMLAFEPSQASSQGGTELLTVPQQQVPQQQAPQQQAPQQQAPQQQAPQQQAPQQQAPQQQAPQQQAPQQQAPQQQAPQQQAPQQQASQQQASQQQASQQQASQPSSIAVTLSGNNEWGELVEQSTLIGLSKELAMNCACEKLADDEILLALAPKTQHLFKEERLEEIQSQIRLITQAQTVVEIVMEASDKETPAECLERLGHEQYQQTKQSFQDDPGVKALISEFGATLNEQSIKPHG